MIAAAAISLLVSLSAGCGMQTDEANMYLGQANGHQEEAETLMARVRELPAEWEKTFNTGSVTREQLALAQQMIQARKADLKALAASLEKWKAAMNAIGGLNVENKIKEYARLKAESVKNWQNYTEMYLYPLVSAYEGLINTIAAERPASEQVRIATDIRALVSDSTAKLEDCLNAEKAADKFFRANKLGN